MDEQLIALYHRHVAAACDRQRRLSDLIKREAPIGEWHYQTSTATLTFGPSMAFEAHDLGSHAALDNSWLWTWCNPHLDLTPANRALARAVTNLGEQVGIPALTATRFFDVEPVLGDQLAESAAHVFAIVIGGALGYDAHYTVPFDNGRFAVLLRANRLRGSKPDLIRVTSVFPQTISEYPVLDHRAAFLGYLESYDIHPEAEGRVVRVLEWGTEVLRADFDDRSRMINLTARINGQ